MQYQVITHESGTVVLTMLRPRRPTIEDQNEIHQWRMDSFKFGGTFLGYQLYFDKPEQVEKFLAWRELQS